MERISEHISFKEATKSNTALRLNLDNTPNDYQITNMVGLALNIFEPLRKFVGGPIKINSFFRCEQLNRAIGGSSRSQHCEGRAIENQGRTHDTSRSPPALRWRYLIN